MKNKDIEQKLQESVENIEIRDFTLVWEDIKHKVKPEEKRHVRHWFPAVAAATCAVVACSIIVPLALQQNETISGKNPSSDSSDQVYFADELVVSETTTQDFFNQLSLAKINVVDVSNYVISSAYLYKTVEQNVKGGQLELTDNLDNSTFYLTVELYAESVKTDRDLEIEYQFNYSVNEAIIEYRVKESYPEDGIYVYDIKANFSSVNYYMEYTCFTENIKPFLDEFFK